MMSPARRDLGLDTFRLGVATRLRVIATRVLDRNVPDGHAFVVTEQFDAAFPNSESITGYGFLHHTNSDVGDFKINGVGTKVTGQSSKDECQEVNFRVVYQWNDRIDPNFSYWTDYLKWFGLKVLYWTGQSRNPMPYNIHISWSQESTYRIAGKKEISTGWPLGAQGSPPR